MFKFAKTMEMPVRIKLYVFPEDSGSLEILQGQESCSFNGHFRNRERPVCLTQNVPSSAPARLGSEKEPGHSVILAHSSIMWPGLPEPLSHLQSAHDCT